jgi:membrane associated rhomboid family serine protease
MLKQRPPAERTQGRRKSPPIKMPAFRLPFSGYYSYAIIVVCIVVFILQSLLGAWFTGLFDLRLSYLVASPWRPWGLVTSMFLHGSIVHLLFNMLALFFFGPLLERRIGSSPFLAVYFGSGILAGLAQVAVFPTSAVIGASGAIFGVLGALTVLMPDLVIFLYFIPLKIVYATILFAVLDLFPMLAGTPDGIAHVAHLVGLAVGLAAGFWYRQKSSVRNVRWQV